MLELQNLAPEIITKIIQYLVESGQLYSVARMSRLLYNVTEPFLYTGIPRFEKQCTWKFLRTLLERPDYASRRESAYGDIGRTQNDMGFWEDDLEDSEEDDDEDRESTENDRQDTSLHAFERDLESMIQACESLDLMSNHGLPRKDWTSALRARKPEACFAIAILLVSNLKTLIIEYTHAKYEDTIFMSQAIDRAVRSPELYLTNLRDLSYHLRYTEACIHVETVAPFMYLPSLRKLFVRNLSAQDLLWDTPISSNIEILDLPFACVDHSSWPDLLRPMHRLKHLTFSPGNPKYAGYMSNTPQGLSHGLNCVKDTLEYLCTEVWSMEYEESLLGSLCEFPKLKEIDIQLAVLIGLKDTRSKHELWQKLPKALEKVTFQCNLDPRPEMNEKSRTDLLEQVMGVVSGSESHFPALKNISMKYYGTLDLEPLKAICTVKGVALDY